jgi:multidrug efflux pump subunit AcrA (membrane-fusion protein)
MNGFETECHVVYRHEKASIPYCRGAFIMAGIALVFAGSAAAAKASDLQVSITEAESRSLGIRLAHPIASVVDQTLAFPARVVIPTPQLWAVNAPIAGMVESLLVARGNRVVRSQTIATLQSSNFVSLQRECLHAVEQEVLANQQVRRNTTLANVQALAQRLLEASETEARQASIAVAERRQMLKLSGMSDEQIARPTPPLLDGELPLSDAHQAPRAPIVRQLSALRNALAALKAGVLYPLARLAAAGPTRPPLAS